jgi:hypothetical protein
MLGPDCYRRLAYRVKIANVANYNTAKTHLIFLLLIYIVLLNKLLVLMLQAVICSDTPPWTPLGLKA